MQEKSIKKKLLSESGAMDSSFSTIIAILLAAVIGIMIFMTIAGNADKVSQIVVQTETQDFVIDISTKGELTDDMLNNFVAKINSTGNSYEYDIRIDVLDENPGKKTAQVSGDKVGENISYTVYLNQVLDTIDKNGKIIVKEGDRVTVEVKNTNITIFQSGINAFFAIAGNDASPIVASYSAIVTRTGK